MGNERVSNSFILKFIENGLSIIIQLLLQIILARILMPSDFGVISIAFIFISLINTIVQSGFTRSLVQMKEANDSDYGTAFILVVVFSAFLYLVLFFIAPLISAFYGKQELISVIRIIAISIPFSGFFALQSAYLNRNLKFKSTAYSKLIAVILSGVISVLMALTGFGLWSLVAQQIAVSVLSVFFLFLFSRWFPKVIFSTKSLKKIYGFGMKMLIACTLDDLLSDIRSFVIGKRYSSEELAFYDKGKIFPQTFVKSVNGAIQTVMLPLLSKNQENDDNSKELLRLSIRHTSYLVFPALFGLLAVASPLVLTLLTEKWINVTPYLQLYCVIFLFWPLNSLIWQGLLSKGLSNLYFYSTIILSILNIAVLVFTAQLSVVYIIVGELAIKFIQYIIVICFSKKYLNYGVLENISDFLQPLFFSLIMFGVISLFNFVPISNNVIILICDVIIGVFIYLLLSILFKNKSYIYMKDRLFEMLKRHH